MKYRCEYYPTLEVLECNNLKQLYRTVLHDLKGRETYREYLENYVCIFYNENHALFRLTIIQTPLTLLRTITLWSNDYTKKLFIHSNLNII